MTCRWCCSQGSRCTFGVSTCTFYTTHSWIVSGNGNGMLYHSEVSYSCNITSYGQCQWVLSKGFATYGPVEELVTCCWSSSQGCGCTFGVSTCTFYTTHSRVIRSSGYGMLNDSEVSYGCDVTCYGEGQWVLNKGFATYGPVDKLMTRCWSSGQGCGCTFGVSTCTFYSTHSWVVSGDGHGMLYHSEVSYGCNVTSYGQCQWVIGEGFATYGPVNKLMTCCWSSGQGCGCSFGVCACTFYRTHSWVVSGDGHSMLDDSEVSYSCDVTCYSQCQWILSKGFATYGPVNKLMTYCWSSGQGCGCTFGVSTCTFYSTHSWIVRGDGHSMLNDSEVSYSSNVTCYGQCQWILSKGFTTYGPVEELMTCCWCSGQGCGCTFGISTCTFYRTHSWVVSSSSYGINWFW